MRRSAAVVLVTSAASCAQVLYTGGSQLVTGFADIAPGSGHPPASSFLFQSGPVSFSPGFHLAEAGSGGHTGVASADYTSVLEPGTFQVHGFTGLEMETPAGLKTSAGSFVITSFTFEVTQAVVVDLTAVLDTAAQGAPASVAHVSLAPQFGGFIFNLQAVSGEQRAFHAPGVLLEPGLYSLHFSAEAAMFTTTPGTIKASAIGFFSMHVVPTPGALGLIAAVGVWAGRRRRETKPPAR